MSTSRTHEAFNPEQFLEADMKKNAKGIVGGVAQPLRPIIQLTDEFKRSLYRELERERPELFRDDADFTTYSEGYAFIESFFEKSLAKERVEVRAEVFDVLYRDFLNGLPARLFQKG